MENKTDIFDIIVVGAGHAGIEAALVGLRRRKKVAVVTTNTDRIGYMSCNPAIGGLGKGHIVREIDALGGEMALAADSSTIQFKRLNAKKGPAVRGSRAQCDKSIYSRYMKEKISHNLTLVSAEGKSLYIKEKKCIGLFLDDGSCLKSRSVILTTGTFMNAIMHVGQKQSSGGRVGDLSTCGLSDQLKDLGFRVSRLKTGTPPRLDKNSIDWSKTEKQIGDKEYYPFSIETNRNTYSLPQVACYLTYTNEKTHNIIQKNLSCSPLFDGSIQSHGPRYCPSIEDKVTRFADKLRHQTFLEPEGLNTNSIYLQGISTSLPEDIQYKFLITIPGLEKVKILRPGYAVEYDFIEPTQIQHSLETQNIRGLFLAGQINGTSGYEEAAGQGLIAGINAIQYLEDKEPLELKRHESYIGVLIDDLVLKGTKEPYRMMTSRAEHRLVLREDNVFERLLEIGRKYGGLSEKRYKRAFQILEQREKLKNKLNQTILFPNRSNNDAISQIPSQPLLKPTSLSTLLKRPEINLSDLSPFEIRTGDKDVDEPVEIDVKYEGYIQKEKEIINRVKKLESRQIPDALDFYKIAGLSMEEKEKLSEKKPKTIGQAQRISGVNPSGIQALLVYMGGLSKRSKYVSRRNSSLESSRLV